MHRGNSRISWTVLLPLAVWLGWLGIGAWSWSVLLRRELHPSVWPPLALLTVIVVGMIALIVRAAVALIRRRGRRPALGALSCGTVPAWLLAAHLGYIQTTTAHRLININPLTLTMLPVVIVLAEVEADWRYPERTVGHRVVMYHDGLDDAEKMVAAADQHLAHLESVLGRPGRARVSWVRGPVLGRDACSFGAFALSTRWPGEILSYTDRHELAHAAINQHLTASSRPPMLLVEGWAEACAGQDPEDMNYLAGRELEWAPSITELAGPDWAALDVGPAYTQGAVFVDQLLEDFGGKNFLDLYVTCSPSTIDADCQRALGVGLQTLQTRHESRLREWTEGKRLQRLLSSIPVADAVDREGWREFIEAYSTAVDVSDLPEDHEVHVTTSYRSVPAPEQPDPQVISYEFRVVRWQDRRLLFSDDQILAVTEDVAFQLHRPDADQPWAVDEPFSPFPAVNRWSLRTDFAAQWTDSLRTAFNPHRTRDWAQSPPTLVEFARSDDAAGPLVQIALERAAGEDGTKPVSVRMTFSRAAEWRNVSIEERLPSSDDSLDETRLDYDYQDGTLAGVERISQRTIAGETAWTSTSDFRIQPLSEASASEFSPVEYGIDVPPDTGSIVMWPICACLVIAAVQMVLGALMLGKSRLQPPNPESLA